MASGLSAFHFSSLHSSKHSPSLRFGDWIPSLRVRYFRLDFEMTQPKQRVVRENGRRKGKETSAVCRWNAWIESSKHEQSSGGETMVLQWRWQTRWRPARRRQIQFAKWINTRSLPPTPLGLDLGVLHRKHFWWIATTIVFWLSVANAASQTFHSAIETRKQIIN